MSGFSIPVLATSILLTGLTAIGACYAMSPPPVRTGDSRPIIDPDAWSKGAPAAPTFQAQATYAQVAETVKVDNEDLGQRGWVAADDVHVASYRSEIAASIASYRDDGASYVVEQLEGAESGNRGSSSITVLSEADADRAWNLTPTSTEASQPVEIPPAPTSR